MSSSPRSLDEWLAHAERAHTRTIDLGLERVAEVAGRLGLTPPHHRPAPRSVIVAGTNGKGSCCMALEALLRSAGLTVGTTLSPHLHRFNERVRLDGRMASDDELCAAFAAVESVRRDVPLSYFEFSALVALHCFRSFRQGVDVAILEVGLGGRLDAFNLVSADVAVITSIGLDHQEWLGDDLESIGREKAGVLRPGQQVVVGEALTDSVLQRARELDCRVRRAGHDFHVTAADESWSYRGSAGTLEGLPWGALAPDNVALALEAAHTVAGVSEAQVRAALAPGALPATALPGRFETWQLGAGGPPLVADVAHNPAGARFLRRLLEKRLPGRRFVAVLGMLEDKDVAGVAAAMADVVEQWVCAPTLGARGMSGAALAARLQEALPTARLCAAETVAEALKRAAAGCHGDHGVVLAFGSFSLVEQVRDELAAPEDPAT